MLPLTVSICEDWWIGRGESELKERLMIVYWEGEGGVGGGDAVHCRCSQRREPGRVQTEGRLETGDSSNHSLSPSLLKGCQDRYFIPNFTFVLVAAGAQEVSSPRVLTGLYDDERFHLLRTLSFKHHHNGTKLKVIRVKPIKIDNKNVLRFLRRSIIGILFSVLSFLQCF